MIRTAVPDDLDQLLELARAMHVESRFRVFPFSSEKVSFAFKNLIELDNSCVYVAEHQGVLVGFAAGQFAPHYLFDTMMAYEFGVYVLPAHRGALAGYRLAKAYVDWARAAGIEDINLGITTGITTDRTDRLYQHLGLKPIGTVYNTTE